MSIYVIDLIDHFAIFTIVLYCMVCAPATARVNRNIVRCERIVHKIVTLTSFIFRAHLNDLENIVPFLLLGFLYISTQPAYSTALILFRVFAGARIIHSIAYLRKVQPARLFAFAVGSVVNIILVGSIVLHYK